jgi:uncharacterized BrkB/YihY/UPF0761 family membrane protein
MTPGEQKARPDAAMASVEQKGNGRERPPLRSRRSSRPILQSYIGEHLSWSGALLSVFAVLRWLIVIVALNAALAGIYLLGPNLEQRFVGVVPGCLTGTACLLVSSIAFKAYVDRFSEYGAQYGALGGVIVLLLWLFTAGWSILFGAELNDALRRYMGQPTSHRMSPPASRVRKEAACSELGPS